MELQQPTSLDEAVAALARWGDDARLIAGGTAVVLMLKNRLIAPGALVSLERVPGLRYVRHEPGVGLRIGALTTIREAELDPLVRDHNPLGLHQARDALVGRSALRGDGRFGGPGGRRGVPGPARRGRGGGRPTP